jgi:hypothetical protein
VGLLTSRRTTLVLLSLLTPACFPTQFKLCKEAGTCPPPPEDAGQKGCASDVQCAAPLARCFISESRCVECLSDADCAAGICDGEAHECTLQPDSCATAQQLMLGSAPITVRGDTRRAQDDTRLACALPGSVGNDLVYTFQVARQQRLIATATPLMASALMPVLGLRKVCNSVEPQDNAACAYGGPASAEAVLTADVDSGTWYLWVDSEGDSAGAFELTLALTDTSSAESCAAPTALVFSGGRALLTGDTRGHTDDSKGQCGGGGAPDNVYTFTLSTPQRVSVLLEPLSGLFAPALYVRGQSCTDTSAAAQIWCGAAPSGQPIAVELPRLMPGQYHLFVDGAGSTADTFEGPFRLTVTLLDAVPAPTNDVCSTALPLLLPANGVGVVSVQGDTSGASPDALGCGGTGNDLVYTLQLTAPRRVAARVTPLAGSTLRPSVYLRQVNRCDSEALADQLGCAIAPTAGAVASLTAPSLPAGLYYLWVDGAQGTAGAFDLTVELQAAPPPPTNDLCQGAIALPLATGVVTVTGTTVSAGDDASLLCTVPSGGFSPDVVYTLDVPQEQALAIDLTAPSGSALRPVFALRPPQKCASDAVLDNVVCAWDDPQLPSRTVLTLPSVDPGTYSLWIEGDGSTQGDFSLRVVTSPPALVPQNDWCGDVAVPTLVPGQPVSGDTRNANDDDQGRCGQVSGANGETAPDVVYRFGLLTAQTVKLTVTPDATTGALFRPVVYVRAPNSCASSTQAAHIGCAVAANYGDPVTLDLGVLQPGTYSVWVDGAGLSSGTFSIRLQ